MEAYRFVFEPLDDGEGALVVDVLHDKPVDGLGILTVDARGLDQLEAELLDGRGVVLGVEVDGKRVDHCGSVVGGLCGGMEGESE